MELYLTLALGLIFMPKMRSELFTSVADMEYLVETERQLLLSLKSFLQAEEVRLNTIKTFASRVDEVMKIVNETGPSRYLGNPVNAYLMLKRFNNDWQALEKTVLQDLAADFAATYEHFRPYFPSHEDYEGARTALFRLQDVYKLDTGMLAKGKIPGASELHSPGLTLVEMYDLGIEAYSSNDWIHSEKWMQATLDNMPNQTVTEGVDEADVLDHLAYAAYKTGNLNKAFTLTQKLAEIVPGEKRIQDNLHYYRGVLRSQQSSKRGDQGLADGELAEASGSEEKPNSREQKRISEFMNYESLCRGEIRPQSLWEVKRMKCWIERKHPLLYLKPAKVERVWAKPEVFLLRDVVREKEIRLIKEIAQPKLRRATIQDPVTGQLRHADYRVSKSAWLDRREYKFVDALSRRAQAITNLDMNSAEQLQVANYGIGGHYDPHFDHAREDEDKFSDLGIGNRIATILFYLSDVEAGGATAFVAAGVAIFPSKGDAAFWYNLKRNGKGNPETRHAACPVLAGTKWVSNWWIHEYGQEFRRKCSVNPDL